LAAHEGEAVIQRVPGAEPSLKQLANSAVFVVDLEEAKVLLELRKAERPVVAFELAKDAH